MKRSKKRILIIISSIFIGSVLIIIVVISCMLHGGQSDWDRAFIKQKSFFRQCGFSGKVIKRYYTSKNASDPYHLTIKIDNSVNPPPLGYQFYYDFYFFDLEERIVSLAVPEYIYNNTALNDSIIKEENSDSLTVNQQSYLLLSTKRREWIPEYRRNDFLSQMFI